MSRDLDKIMADTAIEFTESWVPDPAHTPLVNALAHLQGVQRAQLKALRAAGVTDEDLVDHKTAKRAEQRTPKPSRTLEDLDRLRGKALNKAKWWADAATRKQAEIDIAKTTEYKFDHGLLNTRLSGRQAEADRSARRFHDLEYRQSRARHFEQLAAKYQRQIEKRNQ